MPTDKLKTIPKIPGKLSRQTNPLPILMTYGAYT